MIRILTETRTVYRSEVGRGGRLTKRAAYRDAAWQAWRAKYPCTCEAVDTFQCLFHRGCMCPDDGSRRCDRCRVAKHRRKVIDRLARWLLWRDAKTKQELPDAAQG